VTDVASIFPASLAIGITNVNIQVLDVNDAPIICSGEATTPASSQKYGNCTQHVVDGKLEMYVSPPKYIIFSVAKYLH
jgi:hypothetical protein